MIANLQPSTARDQKITMLTSARWYVKVVRLFFVRFGHDCAPSAFVRTAPPRDVLTAARSREIKPSSKPLRPGESGAVDMR
ncbi:hypothetical protein [Sphingomonas oryzagri]